MSFGGIAVVLTVGQRSICMEQLRAGLLAVPFSASLAVIHSTRLANTVCGTCTVHVLEWWVFAVHVQGMYWSGGWLGPRQGQLVATATFLVVQRVTICTTDTQISNPLVIYSLVISFSLYFTISSPTIQPFVTPYVILTLTPSSSSPPLSSRCPWLLLRPAYPRDPVWRTQD